MKNTIKILTTGLLVAIGANCFAQENLTDTAGVSWLVGGVPTIGALSPHRDTLYLYNSGVGRVIQTVWRDYPLDEYNPVIIMADAQMMGRMIDFYSSMVEGKK